MTMKEKFMPDMNYEAYLCKRKMKNSYRGIEADFLVVVGIVTAKILKGRN